MEFTAAQDGLRVDVFLAGCLPELTRSAVQRLLAEGGVTCGGAPVRKNARTEAGAVYAVTLPEARPVETAAQDIPLDIVYEDGDVLVINKPKGLVVHPAAGHEDGTLVNALLYHCGDSLSGVGGERRPGIVHRIDRDTTALPPSSATTRCAAPMSASSAAASARTAARSMRPSAATRATASAWPLRRRTAARP